jgi:hypothetical protein
MTTETPQPTTATPNGPRAKWQALTLRWDEKIDALNQRYVSRLGQHGQMVVGAAGTTGVVGSVFGILAGMTSGNTLVTASASVFFLPLMLLAVGSLANRTDPLGWLRHEHLKIFFPVTCALALSFSTISYSLGKSKEAQATARAIETQRVSQLPRNNLATITVPADRFFNCGKKGEIRSAVLPDGRDVKHICGSLAP